MPSDAPKATTIEVNDDFRSALDWMELTSDSVFVTGRAGTGKSTLLTYFRANTIKKIAVLAPTGVAAVNIKGQTIHSFFKFKPDITPDKVKKIQYRDERKNFYSKLDAIVIDEISMVRADLLDCVDKFLRLNGRRSDAPFGGAQMIFIGDLYQLPPVVSSVDRQTFSVLYSTPYFFSARALESFNIQMIELKKVYRQADEQFISLLNSIRNNSITEEGLAQLNCRFIPGFQPPQDKLYISLTTTNDTAGRINGEELEKLKTRLHTFTGKIEGDFGKEYLPTAVELQIKEGAQVMMLNNDTAERWVNGTIGTVSGIVNSNGETVILVDLEDGETAEVTPFTWEIYRFFADGGQLQSEAIGTFTQFPLTLAWAVTIHKSQGKTFDRVIIDLGRGAFAHGQTYVALSRCTTLEGIVLKQPLLKKHILTDYRVMKFLAGFHWDKAEESNPMHEKMRMIEDAIAEQSTLRITYLTPRDEKSERTILPEAMGELSYRGQTYLGVQAYCLLRKERRTFRVDRILKIEPASM